MQGLAAICALAAAPEAAQQAKPGPMATAGPVEQAAVKSKPESGRPKLSDLAFASYPGAELHPMGDEAELNGAPAALGWIQTQDPPEKVVRYYVEAFQKMGLYPMAAQPAPNAGYVVYRDPDDHLQHMVTIVQGKLGTYVFPSIQDPERMLAGQGEIPIPLPPGHSQPVSNVIREGGVTERTAHAEVPLSIAKVRAFYLDTLKKDGWVLDDFLRDRPDSLSFRKGSSMLFVQLRRTGLESSAVDCLLMQRQ